MAPLSTKPETRRTCAGFLLVMLLAVCLSGFFLPSPQENLDAPYQPPGGSHLLGTDNIGQDIVGLLAYSAQTSLTVGIVAAFLATSVGVLIGLVSGYHRGGIDELLMRFTDLFLLLPVLPLIILLTAHINPGTGGVILIIASTSWPSTARVVRSAVLPIREAGFVRSARGLGARPLYIMVKHILPNILDIVIAKGMLAAVAAMIAEAGVSFLGLSGPGYASWGAMIHDAFEGGALVNGYHWWYLPPVLCISASVLVLTIAGGGAADPGFTTVFRPGPKHSSGPEPAVARGDRFLSAEHVSVDFPGAGGTVHRVLNDIGFSVAEGEKLALVGHTGSGKSIFLMTLLRLLTGKGSLSGAIRYRGIDLWAVSEKEMSRIRGREMAYVPQGAGNAMDPLRTVGRQIAESIRVHGSLGKKEATARAVSLLGQLGIAEPDRRGRDYPHRYSGGMIQKALLAAAMGSDAPLLLVDEPTKGLDPDSREEILRTLREMESRTILLVTHDLGFAEQFADRVAVVYKSWIVELSSGREFFQQPMHPYSKVLLAAQPERGMMVPARNALFASEGEQGCPFLPWCEEASRRCIRTPPLFEVSGRLVRCWHYGTDGTQHR